MLVDSLMHDEVFARLRSFTMRFLA